MIGYSQTYIVKTTGSCSESESVSREAFFQCGDHCYSGEISLNHQQAFGSSLQDIPALVPVVQSQQDRLSYLSSIPKSSSFHLPIKHLNKAVEFVVAEISSQRVSSQLEFLQTYNPWVGDEDNVYFELVGDTSTHFDDILFIASRVYTDGLVVTVSSLYLLVTS